MTGFFTFMIGWATRSALVTVLAFGFCLVARHSSAATRNLVWRSSLVAIAAIGMGMLVGKQVPIGLLPHSSLTSAILAPQELTSPAMQPEIGPSSTRSQNLASTISGSSNPESPIPGSAHRPSTRASKTSAWTIVGILYVAGFLLTIGRWLNSIANIRRICKAARPFGGARHTLIANNPKLKVPFTFGWSNPLVVLPADAIGWSTTRIETVKLHEEAHMKRNDWIWQSAATINAAVQWFNPASWLLSSMLRSSAEEAADNAVLAGGVPPSAYASELMEIASRQSNLTLAATGMARPGRMATRLSHILAANCNRRQVSRRLAVSIGTSFGVFGAALAICSPQAALVVASLPKVESVESPSPVAETGAKFSNGVTAKVIYIGPGESSAYPTWNPDGSPTGPDEPLKRGSTYSGGPSKKGHRLVRIDFDLENIPDSDNSIMGRGPIIRPARLGGIQNTGGSSGGGGQRVACGYSFEVPSKWKTADLEIATGTGPFHTEAENKAGLGDLELTATPQPIQQHNSKDGRETSVTTILHTSLKFILPSKVANKDWRLLAYDSLNKPVSLMMGFGGFDMPGEKPRTWHASAMADPKTIARYVIEARDYEWAKIKNLSLYLRESKQIQSPESEIKFSDGAVARINFVESSDLSIWRSNGSPIGSNELATPRRTFLGGIPPKGNRYVQVTFEITDLPTPERDRVRRIFPKYMETLGGLPFTGAVGGNNGIEVRRTCGFALPSKWKSADFELALPTGEFHKVSENVSGKGDLQIRVTPKQGTNTTMYGDGRPSTHTDYTSCVLTFVVPKGAITKDWRLVAYSLAGKPIQVARVGGEFPVPGEAPGTAHGSCQEDPKNIAKYVLEARDYERVKFHNVHLYPNKG